MKKTSHLGIALALLFQVAGCKIEEAAQTNVEGLKTSAASKATVNSIKIVDGKLEVHGEGLDKIESLSIQAEGINEEFRIELQKEDQLIAAGIRQVGLLAGKVFRLVLADAYGASSFQIQTTLKDKSVTGEKLHDMGALDGDTLVYNRINDIWEARPLTGLKLRGTWDAELNEPQLSDRGYGTSPMKGDYYIVGESGSTSIDGNNQWSSGNWIVFNGREWERVSIANSAASFNGRTGIIEAEKGDYDLSLLGDVDTSGAAIGHVLKFDGTKWTPAPDAASDSGESIGSAEITNGSLTNDDISPSANIDPSKVAGLPTALTAISANASSIAGNATAISSNATDIAANQSAITANTTALASKAPLPPSACSGTDKLVWSAGVFSCATDYDTNTNAATLCSAGEYLDGDGSCKPAGGSGVIKDDGTVPMAANLNMDGNTLSNLNGLSVPSGRLIVGPDLGASPGSLVGHMKVVDTTKDQLTLSLFNAKNHDLSNNGGVNIEMYGRRGGGPYDQKVNLAKISALPEASTFSSAANRRASLVFSTNMEDQGGLSEKMRITGAGKVGIGTSTPSATFHAVGQDFRFTGTGSATTSLTLTPSTSNRFFITGAGINMTASDNLELRGRNVILSTSVGHTPIQFQTGGGTRLYVGDGNSGGFVGVGTTAPTERLEVAGCIKHNNGTIGSACSSDRRLKDDIRDLDFGGNPLQKFMRLRPRTYVYKTNPDATYYGFIAQEVLEVDKEMVSTKDNGYYAVDYERGKWLHFKASQEMARKIASLEEENKNLKSRLERLEAAVEALQKR